MEDHSMSCPYCLSTHIHANVMSCYVPIDTPPTWPAWHCTNCSKDFDIPATPVTNKVQ